jgi:NitT/TauT family transport system ATP-binding protein
MARPFIEISGLRKVYGEGGAKPYVALSDVTLNVEEGELLSIVGPSGCGKSTLMMIIAGLHKASSGELRIGGDGVAFDQHRDIGMVFQQALLLKWRTVIDNILLPAEFLGLPMKQSRERARDLLNLVGLSEHGDKYPKQLSGGQQQRVSIARSLIHDPKLVLMDEPFGALDALTREKMNLELLRIWEQSRKTILFVTHGISEAVLLGSKIAVMTAGPARLAEMIEVKLPYPRRLDMKTHEEFGVYTRRVYSLLGME